MTKEEAIFCEKSYIGETNCTDCKYYGTDTCLSRESHRMSIKALEQEPVIHAKWEKFCDKDGILRYLECSNCGQVSNQILLRYKYCPNCGAKMDKEDEE